MCGILAFAGTFDPQVLQAGLRVLNHRGPDDSGSHIDESAGIGLAHTRLAILDPSPIGHQPMLSDDGQVALTYNGEIYNFKQLRQQLVAKGHNFHSHTDTEVLLKLYLDQGEALLPRLNGIFAFALWDQRRCTLLIARDGLGVKPLYYTESAQGFACASEIKALLPLLPPTRELDLTALHRYLALLWCPGNGTPLQSVRKLQPGEAIIIRQGQIERRWTWYRQPTPSTTADTGHANWVASTTAHLRQAVHRQMVADVPVGAFLSGGLDSSAIVTFAREQNPDIRCFTIAMGGGQEAGTADDLPYARRVARHLDVPLDVVTIDAGQMAADLEQMVTQLDEPLADPAPLNVLYISRLAQQQGMKVLLSGAGGDDLFTGYRRHYALLLEKWWRWLPKSLRISLEKTTLRLNQRHAWARRLAKLFNGAGLDGDASIANYFLWAREADLLTLYTPEVRAQLQQTRAIAPLVDFLASTPTKLSRLESMLLLEQRFFLTDHNLTYTDKMSMAAGVEVRVPFLDLDLVEFAARVPSMYKQRGSTGKWVLKKAMEPYLPLDVIYRPKTGFGAPLRRWMRHELRELLGDLLSTTSLKRRGLFDPAAVQRMIIANDTGQIDASYILLSLLCIEIWCRRFIDQQS